MEEQFNKEAKQGWIFTADASRITDKNASSEDHNHTSGGVFVAVDSKLAQSLAKKKEQSCRSQEMKDNRPNMGVSAERYASLFKYTSGTHKDGHREMRL